MSWDIYLTFEKCNHCNKTQDSIEVRNLTYNNSKILTRLNVHPDKIKGMSGPVLIECLTKAISLSYEIEIENELKLLEPSNEWGGLDDSRNFLFKLLDKARANPDGQVSVY